MDSTLKLPEKLVKEKGLDNDDLERLFLTINKRYFKNRITAKLVWQVPTGSVAVATGVKSIAFVKDSELAAKLQTAKEYIIQQRNDAALPLLKECADADNAEAKLLISHLLRKLGRPEWQQYAKEYNQHLGMVSAVPAACYYPATRTIALHPLLANKNTPQYVLRYLIYHECCHQLIASTPEHPHPSEFMAWELEAPNRSRAIQWLEKKGFPVV